MIRSQLFKGRAAAVVAAVLSAGLIAGVVGEAYGYLLWGGTPVRTDIRQDELFPGEYSDVYIYHDTSGFAPGNLTFLYTVEDPGAPNDWQLVFDNPPMSVWCNKELVKFRITRNNTPVDSDFSICITPMSGSVIYAGASDEVLIKATGP